MFPLLLENLARKDRGIECNEIRRLFTDADELHGNVQRLVYGDDDSTLCRSVDLRHHEPGDGDSLSKRLCLRDGVLADGAIEDQQRLVRSPGKPLADDTV